MAASDLYNAQNVKVGNAFVSVAPGGTALPTAPTALWTPLASPWVSAGATTEGWTLGGDTSTQDITIEEQSTSVGRTVTSRTVTISATLSEDTLASMQLSFGGGSLVTDGTAKTVTFTLADDITDYALLLETSGLLTSGGKHTVRRIYIPHSVAGASVSIAYRRAAAQRSSAVTFTSTCQPSQIQVIDYELAA